MPRRLAILVLLCVLAAAVAVAAAEAAPAKGPPLPGSVPSPAHFVPPPPPPEPTLAERAVRLARTQLGVPYVYGGSSPGGFDCSGLVMWVYGRLGIALPHNAAALYAVGRRVPLGHMKPGDLVFFHGLGHVGIYIGHGRMIHAPQTGERVEIEALGARSGAVEGARRVVTA
jgi:cell wall-associated NlpC family hydrolase